MTKTKLKTRATITFIQKGEGHESSLSTKIKGDITPFMAESMVGMGLEYIFKTKDRRHHSVIDKILNFLKRI